MLVLVAIAGAGWVWARSGAQREARDVMQIARAADRAAASARGVVARPEEPVAAPPRELAPWPEVAPPPLPGDEARPHMVIEHEQLPGQGLPPTRGEAERAYERAVRRFEASDGKPMDGADYDELLAQANAAFVAMEAFYDPRDATDLQALEAAQRRLRAAAGAVTVTRTQSRYDRLHQAGAPARARDPS
jgi:hypothetical protein